MTLFLSAVASGIGVGFLYGIMGLSIAILYKSTGIISFAQPAIAMLLAFLAHRIVDESGMSMWVVLVPVLAVAAIWACCCI